MSEYLKIVSRKRTWTPVAVDKGQVVEGAEDTVLQTADLRSFQVVIVESDWSNRPKEESVERRLNAAGLIKSRRLRVRASRVFLRPELEQFLRARSIST